MPDYRLRNTGKNIEFNVGDLNYGPGLSGNLS